ncbi:MAG: dTDP-glucose 4,6-dehydratase [Planctomycetota bacterium]|nr:MAG: dTDP-glucose 4,6-dehydratase [Planctomycetota bacterium]
MAYLKLDIRLLNLFVIVVLSFLSYVLANIILSSNLLIKPLIIMLVVRFTFSLLFLQDNKLSWSRASSRTGFNKIVLSFLGLIVYLPIVEYFFNDIKWQLLVMDCVIYSYLMNCSIYGYRSIINWKRQKSKLCIIYGAGKAGIKLNAELSDSEYKVLFFVDDDAHVQKRAIDSKLIYSNQMAMEVIEEYRNDDLHIDKLFIAIPSVENSRISALYQQFSKLVLKVQILPSIREILHDKDFVSQLKDISLADLLARHPKDLDKHKILEFISNKIVMVTGAGGSIGSEICRQCIKFNAKRVIMVDHGEENLYHINEELLGFDVVPVLQSVSNVNSLEKTFIKYRPEIVIHAAAYKHVPMVEYNIEDALYNNLIGTKNCIDLSLKYHVNNFVLISSDKAVRPTSVMGASKRICELYVQNVNPKELDIVAVRFGNVLGSSGSVIPKFQKQIEEGKNITVTDPNMTRYFMLIPEACELVLQAGAIGRGGEIFILDMGAPVKIIDLANKLIHMSGRKDIEVEITGLRPGEKLFEELLINESDKKTQYESILVAKPTIYPLEKLQRDIKKLMDTEIELKYNIIKEIVPEFNHGSIVSIKIEVKVNQ